MVIPFRQINTPDKNLQLIQDNVQTAINMISQSPFIGGNLLTAVSLVSSGNNAIAHGLGRVPTVWVLCGQNSNSVIWSTSSDSQFLNLSCSANTTITLWVN